MCGRYAFSPGDDFYDHFDIHNRLDLLPKNINISPGQTMPVITRQDQNLVTLMYWGLWQKVFNARAETINEKPAFKKFFKSQRCLIPANGFYEWQAIGGKKIPHYFTVTDRPLFAFAALFDNNSYTIITTSPNDTMKPIHDRMPVILKPSAESVWLDVSSSANSLQSLLKPSTETLSLSLC